MQSTNSDTKTSLAPPHTRTLFREQKNNKKNKCLLGVNTKLVSEIQKNGTQNDFFFLGNRLKGRNGKSY